MNSPKCKNGQSNPGSPEMLEKKNKPHSMFSKNMFAARTNYPPSTPSAVNIDIDERTHSSLPRPKKQPLHSILKNSNSFNSLPVKHLRKSSPIDTPRDVWDNSASSIGVSKCSDPIVRRLHQKIHNHENFEDTSSPNIGISPQPLSTATSTPDPNDPDTKSYFEHHRNHSEKEIQEWTDKRDYLLKFSKHYKKEQVKDANKNFDEAFGELCAAGLLDPEDLKEASYPTVNHEEKLDLQNTTLQELIPKNDVNSPWFSPHARGQGHARKVSFTDGFSSSCPAPSPFLAERDDRGTGTLERGKPRHSRRVSFSDHEVVQWSVAKDGKFDQVPSSLKKEVEIRTIGESDANLFSSQDTVEANIAQERPEGLSIRQKIKHALGLSKNRITV